MTSIKVPLLRFQSRRTFVPIGMQRGSRRLIAAFLGAVALIAATLLTLAAGSASAATKPAAVYTEGLHFATGTIVDPVGRQWISDHNAGFCRLTPPTADGPGTIEHPQTASDMTTERTCLGGLLPNAAAGPDAAQAASFLDPSPEFPGSGDEVVFIPDRAAPSAEVYRAHWNADSEKFELDLDAHPEDAIAMNADPARPDRTRPFWSSIGPDNNVYVVFQASGTVQRIINAASDQPTAQLVGTTSDGDGAAAVAVGYDSANALTAYVAEAGGITQLRNLSSPVPTVAAATPTPFAVPGGPPSAIAYDRFNGHHTLYAGVANATLLTDLGIDSVYSFDTSAAQPSAQLVADGFTSVSGMSVRPDSTLFVLDEPAIVIPGEPIGVGHMFEIGRPVARIVSGPSNLPGRPADQSLTADPNPTFTITGEFTTQCSLVPVGHATVYHPCDPSAPFVATDFDPDTPGDQPAVEGDRYRFSVRSENGATVGLVDSKVFAVDVTAPAKPAIVKPTDGQQTKAAPFFVFSGEEGATFTCTFDSDAPVPCESHRNRDFTGRSGPHTVSITATDAAGNTSVSSDTIGFTVDGTLPVVTIAGPQGPTTATTARWDFTSSEAGVQFGCRLDGGDFALCTSDGQAGVKEYTGLAEGEHTLEVHALDGAGNLGPTARRTIIVDTTPPVVTRNWPTTTGASPAFAFVADSPATFTCTLAGPAAEGPVACDSPKRYAGLPAGDYTFTLRTVDHAGNETVHAHAFTVLGTGTGNQDLTGPAIAISAPAEGGQTKGTTDVTFSVSDPTGPIAFRCSVDGQPLPTCSSPQRLSGLAKGTHTFSVTATDGVGNGSQLTRTWTVSSSGSGGLDTQAAGAAVTTAVTVRTAQAATLATRGLPITIDPPAGTRVVRVRLFQALTGGAGSGPRARGAATAYRPVITVYRATKGGQRFRYTLRQRTVRKALRRGGRFLIEVKSGPDRRHLGATSNKRFSVKR
jgi:hypothetical protein